MCKKASKFSLYQLAILYTKNHAVGSLHDMIIIFIYLSSSITQPKIAAYILKMPMNFLTKEPREPSQHLRTCLLKHKLDLVDETDE